MKLDLKKRTRAERILKARTLIASVTWELNTEFRTCSQCKLKHYYDIDERKIANRLQGVDTTLCNVINALAELDT